MNILKAKRQGVMAVITTSKSIDDITFEDKQALEMRFQGSWRKCFIKDGVTTIKLKLW